MKKFLLISVILISLIVACNKEISETDAINKIENESSQVKINSSKKINTNKKELNKTKNDSVIQPNFREHKSIHQIEWEKHQKDIERDTSKAESVKIEEVQLGK